MRILLVDDEEKLTRILAMSLRKAGHLVSEANCPYAAIEMVNEKDFDLIITDIRMPKMSGLELIDVLKKRDVDSDFVLITAYASLDSAISAIRIGVSDYLIKPFKTELLLHIVAKVESARNLRAENLVLRQELEKSLGLVELLGEDPSFLEVIAMARKVALSTATVLIRGASGTGKELLARLIHAESPRRAHPMVSINCGAIPENLLESELFGYEKGAFTGAVSRKRGKVELASGGTLFLDEIAELSPSIQVKLLRFLQEKTFERVGGVKTLSANVRILAATNRKLEELMEQGLFRQDLYYRLNVVSLTLPSLAQRSGDIGLLAERFIQRFGGGRLTLSDDVLAALKAYSWPGNVRELENVMERASVICEGSVVQVSDLPFNLSRAAARVEKEGIYDLPIPDEGFSLSRLERAVVAKALKLENGVKTKTARRLGITRRQLDSKLRRFGLDKR